MPDARPPTCKSEVALEELDVDVEDDTEAIRTFLLVPVSVAPAKP